MSETLTTTPGSAEGEGLDSDVATVGRVFEDVSPIDTEEQPDHDAPEALETREVSPVGSRVMEAATRVNRYLEQRAINKAHGEALENDRERTVAAQNDAFASYEDNIATTADREAAEDQFAADWDEAHRMNDKFDARAARREKIEVAKNHLRGIGRIAKNALLFGVGVGVMTAERGAAKIDAYKQQREVSKAHSEALREDKQRTVEAQEDAFDSYEENIQRSAELDEAYRENDEFDANKAAEQAAIDRLHGKALKMNEKIDRANKSKELHDSWVAEHRELAVQRKEAAIARRIARREKWAQRKETVLRYGRDTRDAAVESGKRGYESARDKAAQQKAKVGRFTTRAVAAGQGAIDGAREGWNNG